MRLRRHVVALLVAAAVAAAALVVTQPQPVAAAAEAPTGGAIRISLDARLPDGTDFAFTGCSGSGCGRFTLDDDSNDTLPGYTTGYGMAFGTYTVTQDVVPGWTLTGITCGGEGSTTDVANRRVTIVLTSEIGADCTFTVQSASITIVQDTAPDGPTDLAYTGCLGAGCGSFHLDDDADATLPNTVRGTGLAPGTYTIKQSPDAAWPLTSLTCNTATGVTTDPANRQVTIVLTGPATHRTCTFKNVTQSLTIVDEDLADSGQDHGFTGCSTNGCSAFTLDDDAGTDATYADRIASGPLPPGTYTIIEGDVPGHELANLVCPNESVDLVARRAIITLTAGETRTCTFTNRPTPARLTGVAEVTTGMAHTCARLTNGQARCWGDKVLGNGAFDAWPSPQVVVAPDAPGPLTGVVDIAAGPYHTCAALEGGRAVCWGTNAAGELGNGTTSGTEVAVRPVYVSNPEGSGPLTEVASVSSGWYRSCAVLTSGEARCWGNGASGALGNRQLSDHSLPVTVLDTDGTSPLDDVVQIVTGLQHSCALLENGEVRCWGDNTSGTIGDGTFQTRLAPTPVSEPAGTGPLTAVTQISATWTHTCARTSDGHAACWGAVPPASATSTRPVLVPNADGTGPFDDVASVAAGDLHSCLVTSAGGSACWGAGPRGQLGHGPTHLAQSSRPLTVLLSPGDTPVAGAQQVTAGYSGSCVALAEGEARCWGRGGKVGDGTTADRSFATTVIAP